MSIEYPVALGSSTRQQFTDFVALEKLEPLAVGNAGGAEPSLTQDNQTDVKTLMTAVDASTTQTSSSRVQSEEANTIVGASAQSLGGPLKPANSETRPNFTRHDEQGDASQKIQLTQAQKSETISRIYGSEFALPVNQINNIKELLARAQGFGDDAADARKQLAGIAQQGALVEALRMGGEFWKSLPQDQQVILAASAAGAALLVAPNDALNGLKNLSFGIPVAANGAVNLVVRPGTQSISGVIDFAKMGDKPTDATLALGITQRADGSPTVFTAGGSLRF